VKEKKWRWAGHVARMNDNRWTKRLTDWHEKRSRKRPDSRWKDEIERFAGVMDNDDDDDDDIVPLVELVLLTLYPI